MAKNGASNALQQDPLTEVLTVAKESQNQPPKTPSKKLHALLIGIDEYSNLSMLNGAVADVEAVKHFLEVDLGVPSAQIDTLRNEEATRSHILKGFQALKDNENIRPGDPILIYYAGHGGLRKANNGWKTRYRVQQIQVIFPVDYEQNDPSPLDLESPRVNCIPDRTIGILLNKLAAEKGDNITVIFDSCHSASGTRTGAEGSGGSRARNAEATLDIPWDIDNRLFEHWGIDINTDAPGPRDVELLLNTDQTSHVHLAACDIHQAAFEQDGRGIFTTGLLKKIRNIRINDITYHNLVKYLDIMSDQSPQCYGRHKDRYLFDARVSPVTFIPVRLEGSAWILEAGRASGITAHSIWELHRAPTESSESVGQFKVFRLYPAKALLAIESPTSAINNGLHSLYARFVHAGDGSELVPKVWISPGWESLFQGPKMEGRIREDGIGYTIVSPEEEAEESADIKLEVCAPGSTRNQGGAGTVQAEVIFHLCDNLAKQYGFEKLPKRTPARKDEVEVVLFAAAKWLWHLRRGNAHDRPLDQAVSISMMKVANDSWPGLPVDYLPNPILVVPVAPAGTGTGQTLESPETGHRATLPAQGDITVDGVVEFTVSSALYGFRVKNNTNDSIFVRIFFFDAMDFEIYDLFGHNIGNGGATRDIAPGGEILAGDGADGGSPTHFSISPEHQAELGYVKVFWSTQPLELDHIKQKSAFEMKPWDMRKPEIFREVAADKWGTACLALVMRAPA